LGICQGKTRNVRGVDKRRTGDFREFDKGRERGLQEFMMDMTRGYKIEQEGIRREGKGGIINGGGEEK